MSLLVVCLIALPGLAATLAVFKPRRAGIPLHIASIFGLGVATLEAWGFLLVQLRSFAAVPFYAGLGVITLLLFVVAWRRGSPRDRARAFAEEVRSDPWLLAAGFVAVLAFALVTASSTVALGNFGLANPFRYWADGLEIAAAGRVPDATLQWGSLYAPTVSKLGFNAFSGAFSYLTENPLEVMNPLLRLALAGSVFAGWALGRELGLRYLAPLVAILAGGGSRLFRYSLVLSPQKWYAGETFARVVLIVGIAVAVNALRNKGDVPTAAAAGVCLGMAGVTHLIPTSMGVGLLAAYIVVYFFVEKAFLRTVKVAAIAASISAAIVLSALLFGGGDPAFDSVSEDKKIDTLGGTFDPTWYLATGRVRQGPDVQPGRRSQLNDGWYTRPGELVRGLVSKSIAVGVGLATAYVVFGGVAAVAALLLWLAPREVKPLGAAGFLVWAGLLVVSLLFSRLYDTYVPGAFPSRRMWSYATFPVLLVGLAAAETLVRALARIKSWVPVVVAIGAVAVAAAVNVPPATPRFVSKTGADSLRAMNWVSKNLPCDARILASQRTGGTFQALTGRVAVTEGMAPYLRPDMLRAVIDILLDARAFFASPADNGEVLDKYKVDYVIVAKKKYLLDKKPALILWPDPAAFKNLDTLEPVYEGRLMDVYRVADPNSEGTPDPTRHPGYRCRTGALPVPT